MLCPGLLFAQVAGGVLCPGITVYRFGADAEVAVADIKEFAPGAAALEQFLAVSQTLQQRL
jgi:hypothetical protein